jgi:hypothetical protein
MKTLALLASMAAMLPFTRNLPDSPVPGARRGRLSRRTWTRRRITVKGNKHRRTFHLSEL